MPKRDLAVNIDGDASGFNRATKSAAASALVFERELTKLEERQRTQERQTRRTADQLGKTAKAATLMRGELASLVAAATAVAPAALAAGAGFVSFAALAAPSIVRVVAAQEDLTGQWDTLSRQQRVSALGVRALVGEYKALARSYEPEALAAFNSLVNTGRELLPRLGSVVDATSGDVQRFINRLEDFTVGRVGGEFLTWTAHEAPQALDLFGTTMTTAGDTALDLVQDLAPLALSMLQLTNGTLSLVNGIAGINPGLAQFAVTALMLRAPVGGLVGGIGNMADRMRTAGTAAQGTSRSARLLNLVTAAGPNLYVAAGVGLGFLALKAMSAKSSTDRLVESLRVQHRATGNNIAGYQALIAELQPRLTSALADFQAHQKRMTGVQEEGSRAAADAARKYSEVAGAANELTRQLRNVVTGSQELADKYGITAAQARRLADASGVDLSNSIDKSGRLTAEAAAKIDRYKQSAELAADPTRQVSLAWDDASNSALTLKDRTTALSAALDAYFNPSIAVHQSTTQLAEAFVRAAGAIRQAKGNLTTHTEKSREARQAFADLLQQTSANAQAIFTYTSRTKGAQAATDAARVAIERKLPILYALAGRNRDARAQVDALAKSHEIATGASNVTRASFMRTASQMGINKDRAAALWREYQKIPKDRKTNVTQPGMGEAIRRSKELRSAIRNIPSVRRVTVYVNGMFTGQAASFLASKRLADGGIVRYADGGIRAYANGGEHHVAQIARRGEMRLWAEDETGGEAYIPLAQTKRSRSETILSQVADIFGGMYVKRVPAQQHTRSIGPAGRPSPVATASGQAVTIGPVYVSDPVDVDMLASRIEFAQKTASL